VATPTPPKNPLALRAVPWVIRSVGIAAVLLAGLGLAGETVYVWGIATKPRCCGTQPYFIQAFVVLAGSSYVIATAYLVAGVKLIALRARWTVWFVLLSVFTLIAAFAPGALWLHPRWGSSIAEASGVGGMGTAAIVLTGLPIWGSAMVTWAACQMRRSGFSPPQPDPS